MEGVRGQIQDDLADLRGVGHDFGVAGVQVGLYLDRGGNRGLQQIDRFPDDRFDAQSLALVFLAAAEQQDALDQVRAPIRGLQHARQIAGQRPFLLDLLARQRREAENGLENVVEVVRDAAGERAQGFHLLGLPQLRLLGLVRKVGLQDRRDVLGHRFDQGSIRQVEPARPVGDQDHADDRVADADRHGHHVFDLQVVVVQAQFVVLDHRLPPIDHLLEERRHSVGREIHADGLAGFELSGRRQAGSPDPQPSRLVHDAEQAGAAVRGFADHLGDLRVDFHVAAGQEEAGDPVADLQRQLGFLANTDVALCAGHAGRVSAFVARHDPSAIQHPHVVAVAVTQAQFRDVLGRAAQQVILERACGPLLVRRMEEFPPRIQPGFQILQIVAQHFGPGLAVDHLAGRDVPVPDAVLRRVEGQLEALLAGPQLIVRFVQLRHVLKKGEQRRRALELGQNGGRCDVPGAAVGQEHANVQGIGGVLAGQK